MEPLQQMTRRQLGVLQVVSRLPAQARGVALKEIAEALSIRPPSALAHLRALQALSLVERRAGKTRLTPRGTECLAEYLRHHRIAEGLFSRLLPDPADSCRAAREIDMALSHRTVERVWAAEGHPNVCPHGRPISRRESSQPPANP